MDTVTHPPVETTAPPLPAALPPPDWALIDRVAAELGLRPAA